MLFRLLFFMAGSSLATFVFGVEDKGGKILFCLVEGKSHQVLKEKRAAYITPHDT